MRLYKNNTVIATWEEAKSQRLKKIKSVAKHFITKLPSWELKSDYTVRQFSYRTIQTSRNTVYKLETSNELEGLQIENYLLNIIVLLFIIYTYYV